MVAATVTAAAIAATATSTVTAAIAAATVSTAAATIATAAATIAATAAAIAATAAAIAAATATIATAAASTTATTSASATASFFGLSTRHTGQAVRYQNGRCRQNCANSHCEQKLFHVHIVLRLLIQLGTLMDATCCLIQWVNTSPYGFIQLLRR
jgi:glucan biosynthesis protein